jgi:UDP-4-amino-4,6-dideoxy-N-acetyl-beta-L-altrosamine N-acetyltransferase
MISGRTISLHPLERRHLDRTRAWANDPELARLMDRARPVAQAEHERWFASLREQTDRAYFAIELNEGARHIGNVWLWAIDRRHRKAELRIVIGEHDCLEKGTGTETISLVCSYAFENLGLHKVYAYVLATNPRARRAFEKAGFTLEGTLKEDRHVDGGFTDVYLLGKIQGQ